MGIMSSKSSNSLYKLHLEDARRLGEIVPNNTVDVTVTSPPYFDLKDYGYEGQIGQSQKYREEYLEELRKIFDVCYDVTKDTGSMWVIVDTFKKNGRIIPLPFDIAKRLQSGEERDGRWKLKDIIIWNKTKTIPWSHKGKLRNIFEYILFFTKTEDFKYYIDRIRVPKNLKKWWVKYPERYNPKGKVPENIWEFTIPTQGWKNGFARHFCPFPPRLVERIIFLTTDEGDVVFDPFAGTGVVLAQAHYMNRRYIGFELNPGYEELFYSTVLPKMQSIAEKMVEERREREKAMEILRLWIKELRLVKYPRTLIKQMMKERGDYSDGPPINSIFAIATDKHSELPKEEIYLIYDDPIGKEKLWSTIEEIKSKPPLSIFGVNADIHVLQRSSFLKKKGQYKDGKFWLYLNGMANKFAEEISFEDWIKKSRKNDWCLHSKNGIPPILSNVRNNQDVREIENYQDILFITRGDYR